MKSWKVLIRVASFISLALGIAACADEETPIASVAKETSVARPGENLSSITLARVAFDLNRGDVIGIYRFVGGECHQEAPAQWHGDKISGTDKVFSDIFANEMRKANYAVSGDSEQMFDDLTQTPTDADYLIGARIDHIEMDICEDFHAWRYDSENRDSGAASVSISWQIFSVQQNKVVYETTSKGSAVRDQPTVDGLTALIDAAFGAASANLAADQKLHDLLLTTKISAKKSEYPTQSSISIPLVPPFRGGIKENTSAIEDATVTIRAGLREGSGFFVGSNLVLTNAHVVGATENVRLLLADGSKISGTVVRKNASRDVALIKLDQTGHQPLPIRFTPVEIAEDVYAIGSPLGDQFAGTVTHGVVSRMKTDSDGLKFIQADASIQHGSSGGPLLDEQGNVVGLAVAIVAPGADETSVGLNFFIPIADALKYLNVSVQ